MGALARAAWAQAPLTAVLAASRQEGAEVFTVHGLAEHPADCTREETLILAMRTALQRRRAVMFFPGIDQWWELASPALRAATESMLRTVRIGGKQRTAQKRLCEH
jgi:hypothetical protein